LPQPDDAPLFTPYVLGGLQLRNRVVMASMTRGRARNAELAPTELHVEYHRQRAAAGLNGLPLSHLQVGRALNDLSGTPIAALQDTIGCYRARFKGTLIANFGFDRASANKAIESKQANLVSFAKPLK
jgi:2,4-dienoyl-CoA reductase-like NADH-dependent reductase (Old Yellow Enzyme family)